MLLLKKLRDIMQRKKQTIYNFENLLIHFIIIKKLMKIKARWVIINKKNEIFLCKRSKKETSSACHDELLKKES